MASFYLDWLVILSLETPIIIN